MCKQDKLKLYRQFIDAVNTWKIYVSGLKAAQRQGNNRAKSVLAKAMFFWRKQAEQLKLIIDNLRGV